jgi:hypothetical protein
MQEVEWSTAKSGKMCFAQANEVDCGDESRTRKHKEKKSRQQGEAEKKTDTSGDKKWRQ